MASGADTAPVFWLGISNCPDPICGVLPPLDHLGTLLYLFLGSQSYPVDL